MSEPRSRKWTAQELQKRLRDHLRTVVEIYLNRFDFQYSSAAALKNYNSTIEFNGKQVTYRYSPKGNVSCPHSEASSGRSFIETGMKTKTCESLQVRKPA